jgi:hypothetical protein
MMLTSSFSLTTVSSSWSAIAIGIIISSLSAMVVRRHLRRFGRNLGIFWHPAPTEPHAATAIQIQTIDHARLQTNDDLTFTPTRTTTRSLASKFPDASDDFFLLARRQLSPPRK